MGVATRVGGELPADDALDPAGRDGADEAAAPTGAAPTGAAASGEEPYSVAMLVRDRFPDRLARTRVTIVGIDRDRAALDRAAVAVYDRDRLGECPEPLVARYFTRTPGG